MLYSKLQYNAVYHQFQELIFLNNWILRYLDTDIKTGQKIYLNQSVMEEDFSLVCYDHACLEVVSIYIQQIKSYEDSCLRLYFCSQNHIIFHLQL